MAKMCEELERRVKQVKPLQKRPYPDEVKAREKFLQKVRDHPVREVSAKRKDLDEEEFEMSKKQKTSISEDFPTPMHHTSLVSAVDTPEAQDHHFTKMLIRLRQLCAFLWTNKH